MSAPISNGNDKRVLPIPTMYASPWAREVWAREEAREAAVAASDAALAASDEFRRALPPAPQLSERHLRDAPFEGDVALALRERPSLEPVVMPPPADDGSSVGLLARVAGAIGLAALAAFFIVGTTPLKRVVKAESEAIQPAWWSRFQSPTAQVAEEPAVPLAERFAAASADPLPLRTVRIAPVQVAAVLPAPRAQARLRVLDRDEIADQQRRSDELIGQGEIAGARLLLTRAAEAGDVRAALALGATYGAANVARLGVRGIAPVAAQARVWYGEAAELGPGEASRRLEQFAQSVR